MKKFDSNGIPTLKALYQGVEVDPSHEGANRHLRQLEFDAEPILYLELMEVPADADDLFEDAEEWEDEDEEDDEEDDGDDEEECDYFPDCADCGEVECTGPDQEIAEDEIMAVELDVYVCKGGRRRKLSEEEISENPALCRFLNQISNTHLL